MNNPEALRAAMNPENLQAVMQMQQAMQRLQGSGLMPQGAGGPAAPGLGGAGTPPCLLPSRFPALSGFTPCLPVWLFCMNGAAELFTVLRLACLVAVLCCQV